MVTAVPSFKWAFCFSFRSPRYKIDSWSYSTRRSPSSSPCKTSSLQSTHSFNPKIPNKTPSKRKSNSLPRIGRSSVVPVQKSRGLTKSESDDAGECEQLICRYVWIEEVYTQLRVTTSSLVRQIGGKTYPIRGKFYSAFILLLVPFRLVSTFLYVGGVQILVGFCQRVFLRFSYEISILLKT